MVAAYKRELETTEGYNGRQLLELIQNCDDEGADKVSIKIDRENQQLTIANNGPHPFSLKGYRSIITSNLSPKADKKRYIGNKGLGFRSIVNWANEISIHSNDLLLTFSERSAKDEFHRIFDEEQRRKLTENYTVRKDEVPIPLLSIPIIEQVQNGVEYTTSIQINYKKDFLQAIEDQVKQLKPEILLFLHSIKEISFSGFSDRSNIKCKKKSLSDGKKIGPSELVTINNKKWYVFTKEGKIEEVESDETDSSNYYQLKLAIDNNMENKYPYLFSFFPTRVRLKVPYLIHGTFDLDQNRNQLNNTKRNKEVLQKLIQLIVETAHFYAGKEVSWKPLTLLNFKNLDENDSLRELAFNHGIKNALANEELWPCVSGEYKARNEAIYIDDEFSEFINSNEFRSKFANLLIPRGNFGIDGKFEPSKNIKNIEEVIDEISKALNNSKIRAELTYQVNRCFPKNKFSLLTNSEGEVVQKNNEIFTPSNNDTNIPSYCKIYFISNALYNHLITEFSLNQDSSKARSLQRKLKSTCRILSYEPQNLIRKIIGSANKELNSNNKGLDDREIVFQMVQTLFGLYKTMSEPSEIRIEKIPLVNVEGDIVYSKKLFLNDLFDTGKKAKIIFKSIRNRDDILAYPKTYGLGEEPNDKLETFFRWLKVNDYVIYKDIEEKEYVGGKDEKFKRFVLDKTHINRKKFISISYKKVENIGQILDGLSIEELISWLYTDKDIKNQVENGSNTCEISYMYHKERTQNPDVNFLKFNIQSYGIDFTTHLVEPKYNWANEIKIDYNHSVFRELNIDSFEIKSVLKSLGGKADFSKLSIKRVKEIINLLPEKFPDGKKSQTLYKAALSHYSHNRKKLGTGYKLFAKTKAGLELLKPEEIYYSDKAKLPVKLLDDFPILNFPSRSGGEKAIDFFGINDLTDIEIEIKEVETYEKLNEEFQKYFNELTPFLLLFRIDGVESDQLKEQQSKRLQKLNIVICRDLVYSANNTNYIADCYEYIPGKLNTYYVKCRSIDGLDDLKKDSTFSDSVANILSDLFDVSTDKTEFRSLFINGIKDAIHTSSQKFGKELVKESKLLLGIGDGYAHFWDTIYKILDKEFNAKHNVSEELEINTDLRKLDYENINSEDSISVLVPLFQELDITISAFNARALIKVSLENYHLKKFKSLFFTISKRFRSVLWMNLMSSERDEKMKLLNTWAKFENDQFIAEAAKKNKEKINVDYESYLDQLKKKYGLTLTELKSLDEITNDPENAYIKNKKEFNSEELSVIESNIGYKSLLYYENELDY